MQDLQESNIHGYPSYRNAACLQKNVLFLTNLKTPQSHAAVICLCLLGESITNTHKLLFG